jgi:hypothetical protein
MGSNKKGYNHFVIPTSRLNRTILAEALPPDWKEQGMEPARGLYTSNSNISVKAIAAAVSAMQIHYATGRPIDEVGLEQAVVFGLTLNSKKDKCLSYLRAVELLAEGTSTEIANAFRVGSKFGVYEFHNSKKLDESVKKESNKKAEKMRVGAILRERQLALEFINLISVDALSRAYKAAAAEFSTDRPGQGDADKATRLNVLWSELKELKK